MSRIAPVLETTLEISCEHSAAQARLLVRVLSLLFFRLVSMIHLELTDLRGSCVASTYSVEDGPKPVI